MTAEETLHALQEFGGEDFSVETIHVSREFYQRLVDELEDRVRFATVFLPNGGGPIAGLVYNTERGPMTICPSRFVPPHILTRARR